MTVGLQPAESSDQTSQDTTLSSMAIGDVVDIADMVDNVDTHNTIVSTHTDNTSAHNKQTPPSGCNLKQDTVISILTNAEPLQHIPPGRLQKRTVIF